jgi:very-short-patch-repair endonuclease
VLNDLLRRHDGVITLSQALQHGLSPSAVSRRVQSGQWRRVAQGVYFADDRPFTTAAHIRAAVWSYGPHAAASGLAAAWWHDIVSRDPDIVEHKGLRVTALELTVVEAAARRGGGAGVVDAGLQRHTELPPLWQAHLRNKGRYGSPRARMLLQAADEGTRSQAERLFARLLRSAGIEGWVANFPVGGYVVDFAFRGSKVAIEIDGFAFHSDPEAFRTDRERQNYLILRGWTVLRFTWQDLIENPERVVAEVRRAISACP